MVVVLLVAPSRDVVREDAPGAPVEVDITGMAPGEMKRVDWRGKPVWVARRTPEMLEAVEPDVHLVGTLPRPGIPLPILAGLLQSEPIQQVYRISSLEASRPLVEEDLEAGSASERAAGFELLLIRRADDLPSALARVFPSREK